VRGCAGEAVVMRRANAVSGMESTRPTAARDNTDLRPDARRRVIVERVQPEIDGGRFPIKRTPGESVRVTADLFADGHDLLAGVLRYRHVPAGPPSASALRAPADKSAAPALRTPGDRRPGSASAS